MKKNNYTTELNILIAEDEVNIALALKTIVKKALSGAVITVVTNGRQALEVTLKKSFQLIISDWNMPIMTGFELLTELRNSDATRNIPFLMLTARGDKHSVLSAVEGGVTGYISKPFENEFIINKVKELVNPRLSSNIVKHNNEEQTDEISIESLSTKLRNGDIDFPVFPAVGLKALELTKSDNVTMKELSDIIKQDTSLTSKLLAIANSSYYGCDHKFEVVEDALLLIGIENTSNIILSTSNKSLYKNFKGVIGDRLKILLEHSYTTAACAKVIARLLNLEFPDRIFAMALMHDVGKLALLTVLGTLSKNRDISSDDVDTLLDELHVEFGTSLVTNWNMSTDFINTVSNHHNIDNMVNLDIHTQVVALADILVRRLGKSLTPYIKNDTAEIVLSKLLDINEQQITDILDDTKQQLDSLHN